MKAFDLRDQAASFRNPQTDLALRRLSDSDLLQSAARDSKHDRFLKDGQFASEQSKKDFRLDYTLQNAAADPRLRFDQTTLGILGASLNNNRTNDPNKTLQERLAKQFDIVRSDFNAVKKDPNLLATADKAIIGLTNGIDPSKLTSAQQNLAAGAREREAVRLETAEKEAQKQRIDMAAATRSLAADMKEIRHWTRGEIATFILRDLR